MPDQLNLSALQGGGLQPGEVLMADQSAAAAAPTIHENPAVVSQLVEMGFPPDGCRRAVHITQNAGLEAAMAWVMEHMGDPDFADPFPPPAMNGAASAKAVNISEENIAMVMSMGFSMEQAQQALRNTDNNVERAVEWIFSHPDGMDEPAAAAAPGGQGEPEATHTAGLTDGIARQADFISD
jgi:ubiquitin carboxyl-terminal hydrolase 5/13